MSTEGGAKDAASSEDLRAAGDFRTDLFLVFAHRLRRDVGSPENARDASRRVRGAISGTAGTLVVGGTW